CVKFTKLNSPRTIKFDIRLGTNFIKLSRINFISKHIPQSRKFIAEMFKFAKSKSKRSQNQSNAKVKSNGVNRRSCASPSSRKTAAGNALIVA
ncbi:hypothetical protein, partial [uncultured Campylobacter sp.]|uniref:hypothetical protein n=1 Tax=uncultured Campylobacter sp. TaxID=218934 RepID=UPI00262B1498